MARPAWEETSSNSEESECPSGYIPSCIITPLGEEFSYCMSHLCSDFSEAECFPEVGCHWEDSTCLVNQWNERTRTCDTSTL